MMSAKPLMLAAWIGKLPNTDVTLLSSDDSSARGG